MVFILYCLSIVTIVGGGALAAYGVDTIRSESGSTFALAGVVLACAGLILLALAAVLVELKRLRRVVEEPEPASAPTIAQATPPHRHRHRCRRARRCRMGQCRLLRRA